MKNTTKSALSAGRPSDGKDKLTLASLVRDEKQKRVNFDLSPEQHTKLKVYAAKHNKTVREVLSDYVASLPE